ncbi:MAG: hypothetical protein MI748_02115 [Opitutales bacterium]|nr:hypothetical protein [Opitutales bacterium]
MKNPRYNNSAGRLLELLSEINESKGDYLHLIPNILKVSSTDNNKSATEPQRLTYSGIVHLHRLYYQFLDDMRSADMNEQQRSVLLNGLKDIQLIVFPAQFNTSPRRITEAEKSLLEVCATVLPIEEDLTKDYINEIRESIGSLRELIENSNTPKELKSLLLEFIRLSNDSIDRFNIYGAKGLKSSIKSMLAEVAELQLSLEEKQIEKIKKSGAWDRIINHLRIIDGVASKILKYKPLLESASKLFLGNDGS